MVMGYNERRVHTLDGRRALRERLSLSAKRQELANEIEALYQAQVRDRNVPHLGFEWVFTRDPVFGSVRTTLDIFREPAVAASVALPDRQRRR